MRMQNIPQAAPPGSALIGTVSFVLLAFLLAFLLAHIFLKWLGA